MFKSKVESQYEFHSCHRIYQGDILRDAKFIIIDKGDQLIEMDYQYIVVLSQDCDLEQGNGLLQDDPTCKDSCQEFNQFLHSVLFVPAFPAEIIRSGKHLESLYQIKAQKINSSKWKTLKQNNDPRYHFLPSAKDYQVPELVLDFKAYYTLPYKSFFQKHKEHYFTTVNELFRERLSQRFSNYLNRIGLPELS